MTAVRVLHPKYYELEIRIRTGQEGIRNSSHGLRTAYRDRQPTVLGLSSGQPTLQHQETPGPSTGTDRESASAAAEDDNLGGDHKQYKRSDGKQECKELRV